MLLISRLCRQRSKGIPPPTPWRYYAFLAAAWLFTAVWLVGVYWTESGDLGSWRWIAWILLVLTTPDLSTLLCSYSRHLRELEQHTQPPERQWFTDVKSGGKQ